MATDTVYGNHPTENFDLGADSVRVGMALAATYQIEAMADALLTAALDQKDTLHFLVQGLGARIMELTGITMSALGDAEETESDLYSRLHVGTKEAARHG